MPPVETKFQVVNRVLKNNRSQILKVERKNLYAQNKISGVCLALTTIYNVTSIHILKISNRFVLFLYCIYNNNQNI